ncbi:MAG: glutamate 5-kinase [Gammaproteobacteria bacterium]
MQQATEKNRQDLKNSKRWVVKIGSALLTADGSGLDQEAIADWVKQIAALRTQGLEIVLVSSGAVAEGMKRLGWTKRPHTLFEQQAAAAVGQMGLVQAYESCFQQHDIHTAQVLLTHEDLSNRQRYLNARSTLRSLLGLGVVPVVNENDTVVTDEIRFGDNDTLAALVANLIEADALIILTDQQGLFDKDPRTHGDAKLVREASAEDEALEQMVGGSGDLGQGGMLTKLRAARLASRSGTATVIAHGRTPEVLIQMRSGDEVGTYFEPGQAPLVARKQWLAGHLQLQGKLTLDDGAVKVLRDAGRSLLPVGVVAVEGNFKRGEAVACVNGQGQEIARGLVNYSSEESSKIMGCSSSELESVLGYVDEPELIHRDNLVLV